MGLLVNQLGPQLLPRAVVRSADCHCPGASPALALSTAWSPFALLPGAERLKKVQCVPRGELRVMTCPSAGFW